MRLRQRLEAHLVVAVFLERNARPRRVQPERVHAPRPHRRIEAEQRPVAGSHGARRLLHAVAHVGAVGDALRVRQDQGRSGVGLRLAHGHERLLVVRPHGDLGDVDAAVGDGHQRQVLARDRLARRGEFRRRAERRRLRRLAAGVRIDLGVEHQDVDVLARCEDVVEPAGVDVVRPAVAADDPHRSPHQEIREREQIGRIGIRRAGELGFQRVHALALHAEVRLGHLRRLQDRGHQILADVRGELLRQGSRLRGLAVDGQAIPEAELGVVLEERVGPRRSAAGGVRGPRRRRQVRAVDRRAARRVGDLQPIAEELRHQLEIRRLAAPGARARELEQRLEELHAAHVGEIHARTVGPGQRLEEADALAAGLEMLEPVLHVDRLDGEVGRAVRRAVLHADAAPRAVLDVDLQREARVGIAARVDRRGLEGRRRAGEPALVVVLGPNHAVRADDGALAALDAEVGFPDRHFVGDVPLLVPGRAGGIGAVHGKRADGKRVAAQLEDRRRHVAHEVRRRVRDERRGACAGRPPSPEREPRAGSPRRCRSRQSSSRRSPCPSSRTSFPSRA